MQLVRFVIRSEMPKLLNGEWDAFEEALEDAVGNTIYEHGGVLEAISFDTYDDDDAEPCGDCGEGRSLCLC